MTTQRLHVDRARYAAQCLGEFGAIPTPIPSDLMEWERLLKDYQRGLRNYRTVVLSAPIVIRQCGILQVAAFWASKGGQHRTVFTHVMEWWRKAPATGAIIPNNQWDQWQWAEWLTTQSDDALVLLGSESVAILSWLRRFTEGRWGEVSRQLKQVQNAQAEQAEQES